MKKLLLLSTISLSLLADSEHQEQTNQAPVEPTVEEKVVQPEDFDSQDSAKETSWAKIITGIGAICSLCCGGYLLNERRKRIEEEPLKDLSPCQEYLHSFITNKNTQLKVGEINEVLIATQKPLDVNIFNNLAENTKEYFLAIAPVIGRYYDYLHKPFSLKKIIDILNERHVFSDTDEYLGIDTCFKYCPQPKAYYEILIHKELGKFGINFGLNMQRELLKMKGVSLTAEELIKIKDNTDLLSKIALELQKLYGEDLDPIAVSLRNPEEFFKVKNDISDEKSDDGEIDLFDDESDTFDDEGEA